MPGSLRVVVVASEVVPFAKTGGLADVTGALSVALGRQGHQVSIIMPRYPVIEHAVRSLEKVHDNLVVPMGTRTEYGAVWRAKLTPKIPVYFIEHQQYFNRDALYTGADGDYPDNAQRFAFFAKATLEACRALNLQPDVLHCHDWQSALIPAYLKTTLHDDPDFAPTGSLLTIHNLAYQGLFPPEVMEFLQLPPQTYSPEGLEFYGQVNYLKAGIVYADLVSTVSRRYSQEIRTPAFGFGLDGILRYRGQDVYGILNGIDDREWNPARDRLIAARYTPADLSGKRLCKRALVGAFGLSAERMNAPLVGMISRLVDQKGFELLENAINRILALDLGLVVLGTGEARYEAFLRRVSERYAGQVGVRIGFDNVLAHRIEAGSDIFLLPSRYEPCGLNQMYSLRYGTIPVVHGTGGLDDTIVPYDHETAEGNGFKFESYDAEALLASLQQAVALYHDREAWERLMRRGMQTDFSWATPARAYSDLYAKALAKRRGSAVLV
ncbi:MAG TPA: glycogen synthase GlgA [Candidatus Tectomicrobia bacterium]|jgi:starch synthase|nr:glycogen synthase GlgA [Candidatus Tectomicrobia bacterium]